MTPDAAPPCPVVFCTRAEDWAASGVNEADIARDLTAAGHPVHLTRCPAELLAAVEEVTAPAVIVLDVRAAGIHVYEDWWKAATYNPFWEMRRQLEHLRERGKVRALFMLVVMNVNMSHDCGVPEAVVGFDAALQFPLHSRELLQLLRRAATIPPQAPRTLRDDRLPE